MESRVTADRRKIEALEAQSNNTKDELNNKTVEFEKLKKQISNLKTSELKYGVVARSQQKQMEKFEIIGKELKDAHNSLKIEIHEIKACKKLEKEMDVHNHDEIEILKGNTKNFTHQIDEKEAVISQLKTEFYSKNEEFRKFYFLISKAKVLSTEALEAKSLVAQIMEETREKDVKYQQLLAVNEQLETNIRKLNFELNEKQMQIEQLNRNVRGNFSNERDSKTVTLAAKLSTIQELVKQLETEEKKLSAEQENNNIASLKERSVLRSSIAELTGQASSVDKRIQERNGLLDIFTKLNVNQKQKADLIQQFHSPLIAEKAQAVHECDDRDTNILDLQKPTDKAENNTEKMEIFELQGELRQVSLSFSTKEFYIFGHNKLLLLQNL